MTYYEKRNFQKIVVSLLGSSLLGYRAFFIIAGVLLFFAWLPDGMSSLLDKIFGGEILKWSAKDGTMLVQILGSISVLLPARRRSLPRGSGHGAAGRRGALHQQQRDLHGDRGAAPPLPPAGGDDDRHHGGA